MKAREELEKVIKDTITKRKYFIFGGDIPLAWRAWINIGNSRSSIKKFTTKS